MIELHIRMIKLMFFVLILVKKMMYGFGDSMEPLEPTLDLMNTLTKDFIIQLVWIFSLKTMKSLMIAKDRHRVLDDACIQYSVRKMPYIN